MSSERVELRGAVVPDPKRWRMLATVGIAQLMLILDITVVTIALPNIGTDLGLDRGALTWVVSAYTLVFGGLMLLGGRAADHFGAKRLILAGLVIFTAASFVAGSSTGAEMLIGARIAQGVGAAMLSPAALSAVVTTFEGEERNRALGVWSALGGGGAALGVLLGGLLTGGPGWPWIFYINVPVGIVLLVALVRLLPASTAVPERPRLDLLGALLVTSATGAVIYGLINAGEYGWVSGATLIPLGAAIVIYALFAWWQRTTRSPLMDLAILTRRTVAAGTFVILIATALMIAVFLLGSFTFQRLHGFGAIVTGLLFLPVAIATMAGAHVAGMIIARVGARPLALLGLGMAAVGLAIPAIWQNPVATVAGMSVAAIGIGAAFVVASATALGRIDPREAGLASGIVSTFHEFGAAIGAAVISSIAAASFAGTTDAGFAQGFAFAAITAAVAAVVASLLIPGRRPPQ
ncbi:MFS transporter [Agromyces sp. SYSU K20354]|uniref:MFS transporter n=1 Tax=Agromyces cavernae TaxID=2898659 RepID=UPI001E4849B5|nr:MFS transporter [Agromyces cavernae]MCD2440885.1 MFS transporter [Agromyces cavernae]